MVAFCNTVIHEIKSANTDHELIEVVANSLSRFKTTKNSHKESSYTINMLVSLQATKEEPLPLHIKKNIQMAIEIFREYRKQNHELLF